MESAGATDALFSRIDPDPPKDPNVTAEEREYERLIAPIEDQMIRCIWRVVRDGDDADDALQDALAVIWKRLDRVRRHPNPHALILRICIDSAYDTLRRRLRSHRHADLAEIDRHLSDPRPQPSEAAIGEEDRAAVMQAIGKLPRNQARAILLRLVEEQPYSTIAEALGCRESTARAHVRRGRARLARLLSPLFPNFAREVAES